MSQHERMLKVLQRDLNCEARKVLREKSNHFNSKLNAENIDLKTKEVSKKAEVMTERYLTIEKTIADGLNLQQQKIKEKLEERSRNSFNRSMSSNGSLLVCPEKGLTSKSFFPSPKPSTGLNLQAYYSSNILDSLNSHSHGGGFSVGMRDL